MHGTQEVRKLMRYDTHGARVRLGVPLFITWSPDEKHNMIMLRLSRCRRNDPVASVDEMARRFGGISTPALDVDYVTMGVSLAKLAEELPDYDQRRAILARDALASVEGFRAITYLVLKYICGVRCCNACPQCNHTDGMQPCQDVFGSNAMAEGGAWGRGDGAIISIEAQKSTGSLHAHMQFFEQCLHQHLPLTEVMRRMTGKHLHIFQDYLRYQAHACYAVHAEPQTAKDEKIQMESEWPEYRQSFELVSTPRWFTQQSPPHASFEQRIEEAQVWGKRFLAHYVQRIQQMKQHHVHITNAKGEKVPLAHCRRTDNPKLCKGDFPRDKWCTDTTVVICQGLAKVMGLPVTGRRSRIGSLHGPLNDGDLNASSPALMAAEGSFNTDVQIPYSIPVAKETHANSCTEECWKVNSLQTVVETAQRRQNAQAGYACDYQNKRAAMAVNEIKEQTKGHVRLSSDLQSHQLGYIGARHCKRLMSDFYNKYCVRSQQERANLNA